MKRSTWCIEPTSKANSPHGRSWDRANCSLTRGLKCRASQGKRETVDAGYSAVVGSIMVADQCYQCSSVVRFSDEPFARKASQPYFINSPIRSMVISAGG